MGKFKYIYIYIVCVNAHVCVYVYVIWYVCMLYVRRPICVSECMCSHMCIVRRTKMYLCISCVRDAKYRVSMIYLIFVRHRDCDQIYLCR